MRYYTTNSRQQTCELVCQTDSFKKFFSVLFLSQSCTATYRRYGSRTKTWRRTTGGSCSPKVVKKKCTNPFFDAVVCVGFLSEDTVAIGSPPPPPLRGVCVTQLVTKKGPRGGNEGWIGSRCRLVARKTKTQNKTMPCLVPRRHVWCEMILGLILILWILQTWRTVLMVNDSFSSFHSTHHSESTTRKSSTPESSSSSVAYAVTITSCLALNDKVLHGAAVVAGMVQNISSMPTNRYPNYTLYAFVNPSRVLPDCVQILQRLNYTVWSRSNPVQLEQPSSSSWRSPHYAYYRKSVNRNGCCGAAEFYKLWSYDLVQHDAVVHVDLDVVLLQPLNDALDVLIHQSIPALQRLHLLARERHQFRVAAKSQQQQQQQLLLEPLQAYIVRDYSAITSLQSLYQLRPNLKSNTYTHKDYRILPVQGGFFVVKPNRTVLQELVEIVHRGHYTRTGAWGGVMDPRFWGMPQIQGLLAYYYTFVRPGTAMELHPCHYNTVVSFPTYQDDDPQSCVVLDNQNENNNDNATHFHHKSNSLSSSSCIDCRITPLDQVLVAHPIYCLKPWECNGWRADRKLPRTVPCRHYLAKWSHTGRQLEQQWISGGLEWKPTRRDDTYYPELFAGYCTFNKTFMTMNFQNDSLLPIQKMIK